MTQGTKWFISVDICSGGKENRKFSSVQSVNSKFPTTYPFRRANKSFEMRINAHASSIFVKEQQLENSRNEIPFPQTCSNLNFQLKDLNRSNCIS